MTTKHRLFALCICAAALAGCMTREVRPLPKVQAVQATTEIPAEQLLDVGVRLFDPNVPADPKQQEKKRVFPEVRKAESRYMPVKIRDTLETTGYWGQVRVVPLDSDSMDVFVDGKILDSTGMDLRLAIKVTDATGRTWFEKEYSGPADTRSYKDGLDSSRDPFQNLYSEIANDMLAARQKLAVADIENVHTVSNLKFAADVAPYAFDGYLKEGKDGQITVARLPAAGDPMIERMDRVRERDYALVDTLNEHYAVFSDNVREPYTNWRRFSYTELEAEMEARRQSTARKLLGAAAVIGGIVAASESDTYAGQAASTAAVIGGIYAVKSGFDKDAEVKMRAESLKQLGESFQAEVEPMVVEVEGRTLELKGSAEQQYAEWRRLLKEIYESETGMPPATPDRAADTQAADVRPSGTGDSP
jgi:hypothetical protein